MASRTLSTSELARGVDFILQDMSMGLPDDLDKLQDFKAGSFYYHVLELQKNIRKYTVTVHHSTLVIWFQLLVYNSIIFTG